MGWTSGCLGVSVAMGLFFGCSTDLQLRNGQELSGRITAADSDTIYFATSTTPRGARRGVKKPPVVRRPDPPKPKPDPALRGLADMSETQLRAELLRLTERRVALGKQLEELTKAHGHEPTFDPSGTAAGQEAALVRRRMEAVRDRLERGPGAPSAKPERGEPREIEHVRGDIWSIPRAQIVDIDYAGINHAIAGTVIAGTGVLVAMVGGIGFGADSTTYKDVWSAVMLTSIPLLVGGLGVLIPGWVVWDGERSKVEDPDWLVASPGVLYDGSRSYYGARVLWRW